MPPAPLSRRTKFRGAFFSFCKIFRGPDGKGTDQRNGNLFFQFFQIALGLLSVELDGFQRAVSYQRKNGLHGGVYEDANGKNLRGEESGKLPDFFPGNISPALWHVDDETGEIRFCFVDVSDILSLLRPQILIFCHRRFQTPLSVSSMAFFVPRLA